MFPIVHNRFFSPRCLHSKKIFEYKVIKTFLRWRDNVWTKQVKQHTTHLIKELRELQQENGSWHFPFETGVMSDAYMILTLRALGVEGEPLIAKLSKRILSLQHKDGTWRHYEDEPKGNLSATIQAYTALLVAGASSKEETHMKRAERFIQQNGGVKKAHFLTKWMLCANGLYPWPRFFYVPMTIMNIPTSFPLNFFSLSTYARIHFVPMMIVANKKFSIPSNHSIYSLYEREEAEEEWNVEDERFIIKDLLFYLKRLRNLPSYMHQAGYKKAESYMISRIEDDGTLYSYATATFFMIYGLLALGYEKTSPLIINAVNGLKKLVTTIDGMDHLENSTSTVWDTALLSYSLQESGVSYKDPMIKKASFYLLNKQHKKVADWAVHNPHIAPGGWGFSHNNTINPDLDDTSAALRAITTPSIHDNRYLSSWNRGVDWLLSMQNRDGGWAAFEKNVDFQLLTHIPLKNAEDAIIDPSTADLTGRVLQFLGKFAGLTEKHPAVKRAVKWLCDQQEKDGSWYGRWGVCYIYGTWAALTGMRAVGVSLDDPHIQKGVLFLKKHQRQDGGWGESCRSSEVKKYVPLLFSTPPQTSWALDALLTCLPKEHVTIKNGVKFLLTPHIHKAKTYPTGIGLPEQFYIRYHSYNYIFPLLALSHYCQA